MNNKFEGEEKIIYEEIMLLKLKASQSHGMIRYNDYLINKYKTSVLSLTGIDTFVILNTVYDDKELKKKENEIRAKWTNLTYENSFLTGLLKKQEEEINEKCKLINYN
jgi:hypothetical protein